MKIEHCVACYGEDQEHSCDLIERVAKLIEELPCNCHDYCRNNVVAAVRALAVKEGDA